MSLNLEVVWRLRLVVYQHGLIRTHDVVDEPDMFLYWSVFAYILETLWHSQARFLFSYVFAAMNDFRSSFTGRLIDPGANVHTFEIVFLVPSMSMVVHTFPIVFSLQNLNLVEIELRQSMHTLYMM